MTVGLRAEALRPQYRRRRPGLPGDHLEYLGAEVLVHTRFGPSAVVARLPVAEADGLRTGGAVRFAVDWRMALLFGPDGARSGAPGCAGHGPCLTPPCPACG